MAFFIGKSGSQDSILVVTRILRGGLQMDNYRTFADHGIQPAHIARKFATRESAAKALDNLAKVGGFTDFEIMELG